MCRACLVVLCVVSTGVTAAAQYPGRGGRGRTGSEGMREVRNSAPTPLSRADLERQDPVLILVSNRKVLSLTDSEMTALVALDATVMEKNRALLQRYDSLLATMPKPDAPSSGDQRGGATFADLGRVIAEVRKNYDAATTDALATLAKSKSGRAQKLLADERERAAKR